MRNKDTVILEGLYSKRVLNERTYGADFSGEEESFNTTIDGAEYEAAFDWEATGHQDTGDYDTPPSGDIDKLDIALYFLVKYLQDGNVEVIHNTLSNSDYEIKDLRQINPEEFKKWSSIIEDHFYNSHDWDSEDWSSGD
jgi:hypothetical protein